MRLWSIHCSYLDSKGLVAVWREALLAQAVLLNKTKGYRNHPQLIRFREHNYPIRAIGFYLWGIYEEALKRGYAFNSGLIRYPEIVPQILVTSCQVAYELKRLKEKLKIRDIDVFQTLPQNVKYSPSILVHSLFKSATRRYRAMGTPRAINFT